MKKSIKKIVSIFMAACMVLPSFICYAGKGGKHKRNRPTKLTAAACMEPDEEKLQALRLDIHTLINKTHPNYKGAVTRFEPLRSKCIDIKNDEELSDKFVDFFASFVKSKGSAESIYEGTILFLSLINHSEYSSLPDPNQDFYLWVAFITLNICTMRDDALYNHWYKLLRPYMPPVFIKRFNRERLKKKLSRVITGAGRDADCLDKASRLIIKLCAESGFPYDKFELIRDKIFDRLAPFAGAFMRAHEAVNRLDSGNISVQTVREAEEAMIQYENEVSRYELKMRQPLSNSREDIESLRRSIRDGEAKLELVREGYSKIKCVERECIERMLSEKTPESIVAAEDACEQYSHWLEENRSAFFTFSGMLMSKIDGDSKDLINWVKYYTRTIKPCMDKSDDCIRALSAEFSDESYEAAINAQKDFEQVLAEYKPEASNQSVIMVDAATLTSLQALSETILKPQVAPEITEELKELQEHSRKNQVLISEIKQRYEDLQTIEKRNREDRQKTEDWKKTVADRQRLKEQEEKSKRCTEATKQKGIFEVVFFHAPGISDPLKFLKDNPQHIKEWNDWLGEAVEKSNPLGKTTKRNRYIPIYENKTGRDLKICQKDGRPDVRKYKGGGELKNTSKGFRIIYYIEQDTNRIVVLYIGEPFGGSHDNPWETLEITPDWVYEPIGRIL